MKTKSINSTQASLDDKKELIENFQIKLENLNKEQLDLMVKKLNFLCLNYDPYQLDMGQEVENIINEYELSSFTSNPFEFTNILLQMLDKTENTIKSRVH